MLALIDIGQENRTQPTTVSDGNSQADGTVSVACTVHPNGGGFDVSLNVSLSSQGSITQFHDQGNCSNSPSFGCPSTRRSQAPSRRPSGGSPPSTFARRATG